MLKILKRFSTYTLAVALIISAISAYYSIVGLTAIFAAAVVPIIIMGGALEAGKLVAAVWLKLNWQRSPISYKMYLVPAVAFLMVLTSMGIFGFLSKAHSDQSLVSGDSLSKIAIYDEKIKVAKDNIDVNRKALKQMDEAVDQVMGRSQDEKGADKAVQIRRTQQKERTRLLADIDSEQKKISKLMEDRAPLAAENRKIEAEVGPIRYIAALIYGDNPDANLLEAAVRWVIILIVAVFDPLALVLILAAQQSMRWEREDELRAKELHDEERAEKRAKKQEDDLLHSTVEHTETPVEPPSVPVETPVEDARPLAERHPYLFEEFAHFANTKPIVATKTSDEVTWPEVKVEEPVQHEVVAETVEETPKILAMGVDVIERPGDYVTPPVEEPVIETAGVTSNKVMYDSHQAYVTYEGKSTSMAALKSMRPDLIMPEDGKVPGLFLFGNQFPRESVIGNQYMRTDAVPHKLFKFNGMEWIHVNKDQNSSYLQDANYVKLLIELLNSGVYSPDMLTELEEEEIKAYLDAE